ncbi:hypothetical protein KFK09_017876 [Dendrobium nobile]|uniref:Uncharacterized protein n=1 Tax=Dendrobium nobile TaxID=94219 RepID=A0A8T3AUA3_DENNO|nr:hypothetical protein KFK09_017876 [Dendrobium nobile]
MVVTEMGPTVCLVRSNERSAFSSFKNIFHQHEDEINTQKILEEVVVVCSFQVILDRSYDVGGCVKGDGLEVETIERKLLRLEVHEVLSVLTSSKELIDLLRKVDTAYHSKQSGLYSHTNVDKYVPSIRQQLKVISYTNWEEGLCESDTDGSFLHENWNQDLKLFNDGEDGALKLLQFFVLRAEHEIHLMSCDNMRSLQALDSIKSLMNILFDGTIVSHPHLPNSLEEAPAIPHFREDVFAPKHPGFRTGKWADIKYKGDWMHRPISDTEVAWLARLLVRFSNWLNESLGFDRVANRSEPGQPTYVELASCDLSFEGGAKEVAAMLLNLIASSLGLFGHSVVSFMRGHGMRINLRMFSSKKLFVCCIICVIVFTLTKGFSKAAAAWSLADEVELTRTHT